MPYLTPDASLLSMVKSDRLVSCADGLFFIISGALLDLANVDNWEEYGSATAQETADYFFQVYEEFIMSLIVVGQLSGIGAIAGFVTDFVPVGWLAMDGSVRDGSDYPELFNLLPSSWKSGGNFTLPDMSGSVLAGAGTVGGRSFVLGDVGGETDVLLDSENVIDHAHDVYGSTSAPDSTSNPSGKFVAGGNFWTATAFPVPTLLHADVVPSSGVNVAHENMPPYVVVTWGVYAGR